jgi:hypothetical protein
VRERERERIIVRLYEGKTIIVQVHLMESVASVKAKTIENKIKIKIRGEGGGS